MALVRPTTDVQRIQVAINSFQNICSGLRIPKVEAAGYLNHEYAQDAENVFNALYVARTQALAIQAGEGRKRRVAASAQVPASRNVAASRLPSTVMGELCERESKDFNR